MNQYKIVITRIYTGYLPAGHSRNQWLTLEELASTSGLHPELVANFVEFGLIEPAGQSEDKLWFAVEMVPRLCMIQRLRTEMGVNLPGVAVILELTEKIRKLQQVIEWREQHGF